MGRHALLVVAVLLAPTALVGQPVVEVRTDSASYSRGSLIEIRVIVSNPDDTTYALHGSSTCQAQFKMDDYSSLTHTRCTADDWTNELGPDEDRTYVWTVDPVRFGLPNFSGSHRVIGTYPPEPGGIEPDTTYFEAPVYRGGQVTVGIRRELPRDSIEPVIDSLNAEVLDGYNVNEEDRVETWQTSGYVLDSVVARYDDDERFRYMEARRMIEYETIVRTPSTVELPTSVELGDNYPNPFNPSTRITYELPRSMEVRLAVFDLLGRQVRTLVDRRQGPGRHRVRFDGRGLPSGLYFYQLQAGSAARTRSMILLK